MKVSERKARKWKSKGRHRSYTEKRNRLIKEAWKVEG